MKFSLYTLAVPLLTAYTVYADLKLPDPKDPKTANFGLYQVTEYEPGCVDAHCHAVMDGLEVQAASISDRCSTGMNYYAVEDNGSGAYNFAGALNFKQGVCGSKPMRCVQNGNNWTCKYTNGGAVAASCVNIDRSKGANVDYCHGSGLGGEDAWALDVLCNSDGSFHC